MAHNPMGTDPANYASDPVFNATTQSSNMVNPRTGLFEAYLKMPSVIGNSGSGPIVDMSLFYSPLSNNMFALGDGWEHNFAIYSEEHEKLTLHTGEKLDLKKGEDLKNLVLIAEWGTDGKLTVYRKGGRTEVLTKLGDTDFYLPESLTTDGYNYVTFSWTSTPHVIDWRIYHQIMLLSIQDKTRTLIELNYTLAEDENQPSAPVTVTYWPDDPTETLRYQLTIEDYALRSVKLAEGIEATFGYIDHKNAGWLMNEFKGWEGLVEAIQYDDKGVPFPPPAFGGIPCVEEYKKIPNGGAPTCRASYKYSYNLTDLYYETKKIEPTKATTYRFKILDNEIISETVHFEGIGEYKTDYRISTTENNLQNSRNMTYDSHGESRKIPIHNKLDKNGGLIESRQDGIIKNFTYIDGEKFFSNYISKESTKADTLLDRTLITKTYEYISVSGMSERKPAVIVENFNPFGSPIDRASEIQKIVYYDENDFRKGRQKKVTRTRNQIHEPQRSFVYSLGGPNNTELTIEIIEEVESFDTSTRKSSHTQSVLSGRLIRQVDTNGNRAEYSYDAFGRVTSHTLCAQSSTYKQTTTYAYPSPGKVKITEPNGRVLLNEYDGQDRLLREYEYVSAGTQRLNKEISYDDSGRELRSTQYDYQDGTVMVVWSEKKYDPWGEDGGTRHSDGREYFIQYDPIEMVRQEWSGKSTDKHRKITSYNRDETIKKVEWVGQDGKVYQTKIATYDAKNLLQHLRTTGEYGVTNIDYDYDAFGRVLKEDHQEIDNVVLLPPSQNYTFEYAYSRHSPNDDPEHIAIRSGARYQLLGSRLFDQWGRTINRGSAGVTEQYTYEGASPVPTSTTKPDGVVLLHEYIKEFGNKPSKVSTQNGSQQKTFTYAYGQQRVSNASEGEHFLEYTRDRDLKITQQRVQTRPGEEKKLSYSYSPRGRLLSVMDASGKLTKFVYNDKGQRIQCVSPDHSTTFSYTDQGQLREEAIVDTAGGAQKTVNVSYTYDAEQRETSRRFMFAGNDQANLEIATAYYADGKIKSVQLKNGADIKGSRSFTYNAGGRLKSCKTTGVWSPLTPKGTPISEEQFAYDIRGNVADCITTFVGGKNTATYSYDRNTGSRLERIKNSHQDYTRDASLYYDKAGRMERDQVGKTYSYDWLGRLIQAGGTRYTYDPTDRLMTYDHGKGEGKRQTLYNELQINGDYALGTNDSNRHLEPGSAACTIQRVRRSGVNRTLFALRDLDGTVWMTHDVQAGTSKFHAYSPYGELFLPEPESLLGAKGELRDAVSGQYPLGAGYRFLDPATRQFNAPDSASPFDAGGPHAYGYCNDGEPVNYHDPSGHFSASRALSNIWGDNLPQPLGLGESGPIMVTAIWSGVGVLMAIMTAGASLVVASLSVAFAVISATMSVISAVIADTNPELSSVLAWGGMVFGMVFGFWTLGSKIVQNAVQFAKCLANTARAIGNSIFQRTATLSSAGKAFLKALGGGTKNMTGAGSLFQSGRFNTKAFTKSFQAFNFEDLNTMASSILGILENIGSSPEPNSDSNSDYTDLLASYRGYGTSLPHGNWAALWTAVR